MQSTPQVQSLSQRALRTMSSTPARATIQFVITIAAGQNPPATSTMNMTSGGVTVLAGTCVDHAALKGSSPNSTSIIHYSRVCNASTPGGQSGTIQFAWHGSTTQANFGVFNSGEGLMNGGTGGLSTWQGAFSVTADIVFGVGGTEAWTGQYHT